MFLLRGVGIGKLGYVRRLSHSSFVFHLLNSFVLFCLLQGATTLFKTTARTRLFSSRLVCVFIHFHVALSVFPVSDFISYLCVLVSCCHMYIMMYDFVQVSMHPYFATKRRVLQVRFIFRVVALPSHLHLLLFMACCGS